MVFFVVFIYSFEK